MRTNVLLPLSLACLLANICHAQSNAPLGLEWGMSREAAGECLTIQHGFNEGHGSDCEVYSGIKLGSFEGCKVLLFFVNEELAAVRVESSKSQNWAEKINKLADMFTRTHGQPIGNEVSFRTLETGIDLTWNAAQSDGQPVKITLEANHSGFGLTYFDVARLLGNIPGRPTLSIGIGNRVAIP